MYHILMKKSCLYFDKKKYECVSFIVHYKGLTLTRLLAEWAKPEGEGKQTHHPPTLTTECLK